MFCQTCQEKLAKPEVKPEVEDSKPVGISKLKKPDDEDIETAGKLKLGHHLKLYLETGVQFIPMKL